MSRVLVVDDEEEICMLLSGMMKKLGFEATSANTLEEGRKKLKQSDYNLIFLDLNLPDGLGFHLIEHVNEQCPGAKVIIISAYDGNIERQRARTEGADYFIPKPFSKQAVVDALEDLDVSYSA